MKRLRAFLQLGTGDIQTINAGVNPAGGTTYGKTDISGTPGNGVCNTPLGRCAIAIAATNVVITSSLVTTASRVFVTVNQAATDVTLTAIVRVIVANGSFTIVGIAAATAAVVIDFIIFP